MPALFASRRDHACRNISRPIARSWDERVAIHRRDETGFYEVAKVLARRGQAQCHRGARDRRCAGLRIAHLQCHFGLDSICLERRGAIGRRPRLLARRDCRGPRSWREAMNLKARFVEGNVYDARSLLDGDFDMVYVTWGAINWLPDIAAWADGRRFTAQAGRAALSRRIASRDPLLRMDRRQDRTALRLAHAERQTGPRRCCDDV